MRVMTASEASRNFSALLDAIERGETVAVSRGGKRIATNLFTIAVSLGMSKLCFMLFDWGTRHIN